MPVEIIIEEIVSNVRAHDREHGLSPEVLRQIIAACTNAVKEHLAHDERVKEERSVDGVLGKK